MVRSRSDHEGERLYRIEPCAETKDGVPLYLPDAERLVLTGGWCVLITLLYVPLMWSLGWPPCSPLLYHLTAIICWVFISHFYGRRLVLWVIRRESEMETRARRLQYRANGVFVVGTANMLAAMLTHPRAVYFSPPEMGLWNEYFGGFWLLTCHVMVPAAYLYIGFLAPVEDLYGDHEVPNP